MRTEADLRAALLSLEADAPTVGEVLRVLDPRPRRRVPGWVPPLAAALVIAAIALVTVVVSRHDTHGQPASPHSMWRVEERISVPGTGFIGYGADSVWVVELAPDGHSALEGNLYRLDPSSGTVEDTIPQAAGCCPVVGDGAVWLSTRRDIDALTRVDLATHEVQRIAITANGSAAAPGAIVLAGDSVWIGNAETETVSRIDPDTDVIQKEIHVGKGATESYTNLVTDGTSIFVNLPASGQVARIDAASGTVVSRIPVAKNAGQIAIDGDTLYAATATTIYRINVSILGAERVTGQLTLLPQTADRTLALRVGYGSLWVAREHSTGNPIDLLRVDLGAFSQAQQVSLPRIQRIDSSCGCQQSADLAIGAEAVWLRVPGQVLALRPHKP
jgi:hypothetical protein